MIQLQIEYLIQRLGDFHFTTAWTKVKLGKLRLSFLLFLNQLPLKIFIFISKKNRVSTIYVRIKFQTFLLIRLHNSVVSEATVFFACD